MNLKEYIDKSMGTVKRFADPLGRGSAVVTGSIELVSNASIPGYLALPAALFAAGQTAKLYNDTNSRPEYWKGMPFIYRLPRYAKDVVSWASPFAALGFLATGESDTVNAAAIGASAAYIGSETLLERLAQKAEDMHLNRHPEIKVRIKGKELAEARAALQRYITNR